MTTALTLAALALAYGAAAGRAGRWPVHRSAAWAAGLAALALALVGPLDAAADVRLSAHMLQHALLSLVAAPLLVAGAPVRLALRTLGRADRRRLAAVLHSRPARALARPAAGAAAFALTLAVVHVPAVYDLALRVPLVHAAEHAALFWSAVALWSPLVAADPVPRRAGPIAATGALIAAMTAMGAVGAVIAGSDHLLYRDYARPGVDALADQSLAGGLMWIGGMVVVLPALLALAWRALADEERRQRVRDARATTGPRP